MLTIRYTEPTMHEQIMETEHVSVEPPNEFNDNKLTVWVRNNEGRSIAFNTGNIYVMNSFGKTVAIYNLYWPYPEPEPESSEVKS